MIDTHCHIDLYPKPTEIADRANRAKVITVLVTNTPSAFERSYPHVKQFPNIRIALGLHPLVTAEHQTEKAKFISLVDKTSYIGEIGLDFSPAGFQTKDIQIESFKFVFEALKNKPKFITIHSRRAEAAVLELLDEVQYPFPVVFHWYSGALNVLDKAINKGHYFSVNPAMLESPNGKKIVERLPLNRILTESDGPFVRVKSRTIEPSDVSLVENFLASKFSESVLQVRGKIRENFLKVLNPVKVIKQKAS